MGEAERTVHDTRYGEKHEQRQGESAWRLLGKAVRGTTEDYTEGSLKRAVFLLSVPMILEMVMESAFGITDVFFVGRLGVAAGDDPPRIHPLVEQVDGFALARRVDAGKKDDDGKAGVQELTLRVQELVPELGDLRLELRFRKRASNLRGFEHGCPSHEMW